MVLKIQKYDMNIKFEITKTFNEESILDKKKIIKLPFQRNGAAMTFSYLVS